MRVLVTGAAGSIGRVVILGLLDRGHEVVGLDLVPEPGGIHRAAGTRSTAPTPTPCDAVFDQERLDGVVHLAGHPGEADLPTSLTSHVITTAALLDACVAHRVSRFVYASSNHAVGRTPRASLADGVISDDALPRPDTFYGVGKVAAEALMRLYVDRHSIDAIACRIGSFLDEPGTTRALSTWLSPDDCVRMVDAALTAPAPGFAVLYGISNNTRRLVGPRARPTARLRAARRCRGVRRPRRRTRCRRRRGGARRWTVRGRGVLPPRARPAPMTFLDLLYTGAARADFDALVAEHPRAPASTTSRCACAT